jgi:tetratricopeptide (TPR) repeat protein
MILTFIRARLLCSLRFLPAVSLLILPWVTTDTCFGQGNPSQIEEVQQARQALNLGVQAYKNGEYEEAERYFAQAKQLDPKFLNARLYLATTYASQYIPAAPSEENIRLGQSAVEEFRGVLSIDAQSISAIDGIGSILFQMAGTPFSRDLYEESRTFHQKHIQLRPNDPEPYYWIGVIDWVLSFRANGEFRRRFNQDAHGEELRDTDSLPPGVREQYASEYGDIIDKGIENAKHAIELKPDYDDAMAYLNLLYRRKADTVASESERDGLTKMADDLIDKVKEIKQRQLQASPQP